MATNHQMSSNSSSSQEALADVNAELETIIKRRGEETRDSQDDSTTSPKKIKPTPQSPTKLTTSQTILKVLHPLIAKFTRNPTPGSRFKDRNL
jgi:hypothetical protein